jgi:dUTP pyrophosphatase
MLRKQVIHNHVGSSISKASTMNTGPEVIIKVMRLTPEALLPEYKHAGDAGADLFAVAAEGLNPFERKAISLGISIELPLGFEAQIRPRSGLALHHGVTVLNTPGTIDAGYRGELKVILINLSSEPYQITKGQRVAQLVVAPVTRSSFQVVTQLLDSDRGSGGFGSVQFSHDCTSAGFVQPSITVWLWGSQPRRRATSAAATRNKLSNPEGRCDGEHSCTSWSAENVGSTIMDRRRFRSANAWSDSSLGKARLSELEAASVEV